MLNDPGCWKSRLRGGAEEMGCSGLGALELAGAAGREGSRWFTMCFGSRNRDEM